MGNSFFGTASELEGFQQTELTNVLRLTDISVVVATAEQRESSLNREDPITDQHAYLQFSWAPLSYELISPKTNNLEIDGWPSYKLTKGHGLDDAQVQAVREHGFQAIPNDLRIKAPSFNGTPTDKQIEKKAKTLMTRHLAFCNRAGMTLVGTDENGQPVFKDGVIGGIYEVRGGEDTFPVPKTDPETDKFYWDEDDTYDKYIRYPIKVVEGYIIPDNRPVFDRTKTAEDRPEPTAAPTVAELDLNQLRQALVDSRFDPSVLLSASEQAIFLAQHIGDSEATSIFGDRSLNEAALAGELTEHFVGLGVLE